jgi:hypothetical protein
MLVGFRTGDHQTHFAIVLAVTRVEGASRAVLDVDLVVEFVLAAADTVIHLLDYRSSRANGRLTRS